MYTFTAFYNTTPFEQVLDFQNGLIPFMTVQADNLQDAFKKMQGENISPNGELREKVKELGLNHTSMMVGDVFYWHEKDLYFRVDMIGFSKIKPI